MSFLTTLEGWGTSLLSHAETFLLGVGQEGFAEAEPIVEGAVANLSVEEATALATGDAKDTGHILAKVTSDATTQLKAAGIKLASNTLLTLVGTKAANAPALVAAKSAS